MYQQIYGVLGVGTVSQQRHHSITNLTQVRMGKKFLGKKKAKALALSCCSWAFTHPRLDPSSRNYTPPLLSLHPCSLSPCQCLTHLICHSCPSTTMTHGSRGQGLLSPSLLSLRPETVSHRSVYCGMDGLWDQKH